LQIRALWFLPSRRYIMHKPRILIVNPVLLYAMSAMVLSGGAFADNRPDSDSSTPTTDQSIEATIDITKTINVDVTKQSYETSSRQDLSAELSDLTIVVSSEANTLADGGVGSTLNATLSSGPLTVSTGDNFGGIANFNI